MSCVTCVERKQEEAYMKIRSPMDAVELSRIRAIGEKVLQLQKQGKDIIRLQIGEPDFCTPNHIIRAADELSLIHI